MDIMYPHVKMTGDAMRQRFPLIPSTRRPTRSTLPYSKDQLYGVWISLFPPSPLHLPPFRFASNQSHPQTYLREIRDIARTFNACNPESGIRLGQSQCVCVFVCTIICLHLDTVHTTMLAMLLWV